MQTAFQTANQIWLYWLGYGLGLPLIGGLLLAGLSHQCKKLIVTLLGWRAQVYGGGLGVMIHELSHLLMALVFGHHIVDFQLLVPPWKLNPQADGQALGYVVHQGKNNWWSKAGNVFIGLAPLFGGTLVLWLVTYFGWPELAQFEQHLLTGAAAPHSLMPTHWGRWIIWLLVTLQIAIGGFDLSPADYQNAGAGVVTLLVGLYGFSWLGALFGVQTILEQVAQHWGILALGWLGSALLLLLVVTGLLTLLNGRRA